MSLNRTDFLRWRRGLRAEEVEDVKTSYSERKAGRGAMKSKGAPGGTVWDGGRKQLIWWCGKIKEMSGEKQ